MKYNMEYLEDKEPKDLGIYIRDENHQVKGKRHYFTKELEKRGLYV